MNIARGTLLGRLNEASIGLSAKETVEQSSCFIFKGKYLTTFNDEIMVRVANPLDFDCVVSAAGLLELLAKMPDDEISVNVNEGELLVKGMGKQRRAGMSISAEVTIPLSSVPSPNPQEWSRLVDGVNALLQQAARTCGDDEAQYLATCVHITPNRVEACDNSRLFRADADTGFPGEVLVPATSIEQLEKMEIVKVAIGTGQCAGWIHFKTASGAEISCRCSHEKYHKSLDAVLEIKNGEKITLPVNLGDMVERAEIFHTGKQDGKVGITLTANQLVITSRKEGGWYKEKKSIEYAGRAMAFDINPKFLVEILERTRDVEVDDRKMKITSGHIQFVVGLHAKVDKFDPPAPPTKPAKPFTPPPFEPDDIPF